MSLTLVVWLAAFALFAVMAFAKPIWGIALYFLSYFGDPATWWWGVPIVSVRWNLIAGLIALTAVLVRGQPWFDRHRTDWLSILMLAIAANATFVHFALAPNLTVSATAYELLIKFVLLFFLMKTAVTDRSDFIVLIMIFLIALGHIGYEVKVNDAGTLVAGRLENVGPPAARTSNQLGSLFASLLPLFGAALFCANRWQKMIILCAAPFAVNILLMTKSRGALLAALLAAPVFLSLAPPRARRVAFWVVVLGGICTVGLMRDESIANRFLTTFAGEEERDNSAASRLDYWKAGLRMVNDHPFGAGGDGFSDAYGMKYLASLGHHYAQRSVHSGLINEACQWGVQGFLLRVTLVVYAALLALRRSRQLSRTGQSNDALLGAALLSGIAAFCVSSVFGDVFDNEWGYWLVAMVAAYDRVFSNVTDQSAMLYQIVSIQPQQTNVESERPDVVFA